MKVAGLWRYPVKSIRGEPLAACEVGARGLAGDRRFAIVDAATGKVASAKHPRKWGALLAASARARGDVVEVELPGGGVVRTDDPLAADALSAYLGRDVRISDTPAAGASAERITSEVDDHPGELGEFALGQGAPAGTFFDFGPVHLVTTSTLAALGDPDARRFRPNLVIESDEVGFVEDAWIGKTLAIADVRLLVVVATPRCVIPTLAHGALPTDAPLLRTIARAHLVAVQGHAQPCVGVYAIVVTAGRIQVGDAVEIAA